jgi:hypothetical protein
MKWILVLPFLLVAPLVANEDGGWRERLAESLHLASPTVTGAPRSAGT